MKIKKLIAIMSVTALSVLLCACAGGTTADETTGENEIISSQDGPESTDPAAESSTAGSEKTDGDKEITGTLIEYYEKSAGTAEAAPGVTYSLIYENGTYTISVRPDGGKVSEYPADGDIYSSVMNIALSYGMPGWNGGGEAADGKICRLSIIAPDGSEIKATSDNMPENGPAAFASVKNILSENTDENTTAAEEITYDDAAG